jgi:uncharacterized membrane protein
MLAVLVSSRQQQAQRSPHTAKVRTLYAACVTSFCVCDLILYVWHFDAGGASKQQAQHSPHTAKVRTLLSVCVTSFCMCDLLMLAVLVSSRKQQAQHSPHTAKVRKPHYVSVYSLNAVSASKQVQAAGAAQPSYSKGTHASFCMYDLVLSV